MVIDMHAHLWAGHMEQDKEEILRAMDEFGIDKVYVSALKWERPTQDEVEMLNHAVAAFHKEHEKEIGGYVFVNPVNQNALDVLKRGIEEQGMLGMKLWIDVFCDDPCVYPLIEKTIDYGVPVLIHAFYKANGQMQYESIGTHVANLAKRYPEAKLIMAHLGGNSYHGIPAIRHCANVWVDYSGSIFRGDDLEYAVECLGSERIMHGSDMPGSYLVNYGQVLEARISQAEKENILYRNALKVFDRSFRLGGQK